MSSTPTATGQRRPRLYQNDIVHVPKAAETGDSYAIVLRCWHDPEDIPPQAVLADPLLRPLKQGEVNISYISHGAGREIVEESDVLLIDRGMQIGDFCKRSIDDFRSGVVTNVKVKARVAHVINGEVVEGWKATEDLLEKQGGEVGDYVVYDEWLGQIIEVFDESIIETSSGQLVRLPEIGSRLATGDEGTDILPPYPAENNVASALRSFFGGQQNRTSVDRVINVKHTVYAVAWLALNQTLSQDDAALRSRPARFWAGTDISKLTLIRGKSDAEMRVGDRVYLRDTTGLPMTEHGKDADPAGIMHVQTFKVNETVTTVEVLWQDGVKEMVNSTQVIPYVSPDEYDCWPGDHVVWKAENQKRFAVVQSVDPNQRTATVLFTDDGSRELVSVLELDPTGDSEELGPHDALGVRRGDFVFIHSEGATNGATPPKVPHIGELEAWVREVPIINGQYSGWRKEFSELGHGVAAGRGSGEVFEGAIKRPIKGDSSMYWIGEVTELNLDGTAEVTRPDMTIQSYPLERLTRLYDGMDQLQDDPWIDTGSEYGDYAVDEFGNEVWEESNESWPESFEPSEGHGWNDQECDCGQHHPLPQLNFMVEEELETEQTDEVPKEGGSEPQLSAGSPIATSPVASGDATPDMGTLEDVPVQALPSSATSGIPKEADEWRRFDILPSAPADHAYYSTVPVQPSRTFLARLSKEYKALTSSLPDSIIVRAFEDRADLLRCLIIGPENTPYQDAPFVIDWMLDSNFPHSPPIAFFHSWTNGNGRVNPNLYEEGKVCLSILGTWMGDQSETWSATRSSLLQALVSIQGLVLVKEPWFCEPAYDKLRGTEEGMVNSRLYNEKAYVLSRGFVRRALELPLGGLEQEIEWLYYTKGTLAKVLHESQALVEKSKKSSEISPEDNDLAIPRLTAGGIITLERTLHKLQDLYDKKTSAESPALQVP